MKKANDGGNTPLMKAASEGDIEEIRKLLDVNSRSNYNTTALMAAAFKGQTGAIRELLRSGANIEARQNDGSTALDLAVSNDHTEAIRELVKAGADVNRGNDSTDVNSRTPLMIAALRGQREAIWILLKAGADKRARDGKGKTAFYLWGKYRKEHPAFEEISKWLDPGEQPL